MKNSPTLVVLTDPFPTQNQLIDHQSLHGPSSSSIDEVKMMSSETIHLNTRSQSYEPPVESKTDDVPSEKPSGSTPPPSNGLQINKLIPYVILHPLKSTLQKSILNPNARVAQYYNIVEYLAQSACAMSTL